MTYADDAINNSEQGPQDGLTKREYFAAMAMQGLLATVTPSQISEACCEAVRAADMLVAELNKTEEQRKAESDFKYNYYKDILHGKR